MTNTETKEQLMNRRALYVQQRLSNIKHKRREINKIAEELFLNPLTIWRDSKRVL